MTTTQTISREQLKAFINDFLSDPAHDDKSKNSMTADVFRLALAALDSEPVAWASSEALNSRLAGIAAVTIPFVPGMDIPLFRHPVITHNGDCDTDPFGFARRSGDLVVIDVNGDPHVKDGMPLYAAPPAQELMKDHQIRELVNDLRDIAIGYHGTQQLRERIAGTVRAAMLQAGNHTEQHLDMVDHSGDANEKVDCRLTFDQWLSQQNEPIDVDCGCVSTEAFYHWLRVAYEAGNSPVTPDGWVMVPKRLTAENGAKGALSGEFSETTFISCLECFGDDDCDTCDGSGRIEIKVPVTWSTIKSIWDKGIEYFAAKPSQEVK